MNKEQIIEAMASELKFTKADAERSLNAFLNITVKALKKGVKVKLVDFGTFTVVKRAARIGRNVKANKEVKIPARKVVRFKAGLDLSQKVR